METTTASTGAASGQSSTLDASSALLAAFAAAVHSPRSAALCKPLPRGVDVEKLRDCLPELSSRGLASKDVASVSPDAAAITALIQERKERFLTHDDSGTSWKQLTNIAWADVMGRQPDLVLSHVAARTDAFTARAAEQSTVVAFHGAPFENLWSILNIGFVNAAQVDDSLGRQGKTRSLYGKGIYLSRDPTYASTFGTPCPPLPHNLGRWRCLFMCVVARGPMVTVGGDVDSAVSSKNPNGPEEVRWANKDANNVPDGVVVVEDSDAIGIHSVLLWHEPAADWGLPFGMSLETLVVVVVVLAVLIAMWAQKSPGRRF